MPELDLEKLQSQIKFANLIEQCQTLKLITPEERAKYFEQLNDKVHTEIETVIAEE